MEITLEKLTRDVIGKHISAVDIWEGDRAYFIIGEIAFKIDGFVRIVPKNKKETAAFHPYIEIKREVFDKLVENKKAVDATMIDGCVVQWIYELS